MQNQFTNIADAFRQQFGFNPPVNYKIPQKQQGTIISSTEFSDLVIPAKAAERTRGNGGSAYYATDVYGRQYYMPVSLGTVELWFPVVSIELGRTTESTRMVERRGSVHEIINTEDIVINVKGLIVGYNNQFPEDELTALNELFNLKGSLSIRSVITDIFLQADDKVIIQKVPITPKIGVKHVIPYEMNLVSDLINELEVL